MADHQHPPLPEAPVSWTVRCRSTQGYDCMLTLRGHDASDVLRQAHTLMGTMSAAGADRHDGSMTLPADVAGGNPAWCPMHQCAMKRRERDGQVRYSHKAPDGTWSRGKPVAEAAQ